AIGGEQAGDVLRETRVVPGQRFGKGGDAGLLERWIRVDSAALAPFFAEDAFLGPADALRFDTAVVGRDEHVEAGLGEQVEEFEEEAFVRPGGDLAGHAESTELHAVHDLVNFVEGDSKRPGLWGDGVLNYREIGVIARDGNEADVSR